MQISKSAKRDDEMNQTKRKEK